MMSDKLQLVAPLPEHGMKRSKPFSSGDGYAADRLRLFVSKRVDRVQSGGLDRRVVSEYDADQH
jgi:hypothetical protein